MKHCQACTWTVASIKMFTLLYVIHMQGDSGGPYFNNEHEVSGVHAFRRGTYWELITYCGNIDSAAMSTAA